MRRIIPSSAPWKMSGISRAKVTRDAEPDFRFERRTRQGIIVLRPQGTSRSEEPRATMAAISLVFPFRRLSAGLEEMKVKGITVEELGLKVGDSATRGPGTITLKEQDGQYWVTELATGAAQSGDKK